MKRKVQRRTSTLLFGMLCAFTCLQATPLLANFYQKVDIAAKNKTLKSILQDLERQSGFYFLYDNEIVSKHANLSIDLSNVELKEALQVLSETIGVSYKIVDKTVTLYYTHAQRTQAEIRLRGIVRLQDEDSNGLTTTNGISIQVKGTNRGTTTNFKGEFSLNVPANSTIIISYLGYAQKEISNVQSTFIDIALEKSERAIDEVIVSAYGTKESKENQIGSAYTVTSKDIEKMPNLRIDALLQGIVPGLEFSSQDDNNSSPRARFKTRIRGEASSPYGTMANDPLWVVDGVPLNTGGTTNMISGVETSISPLTYLNTEDIESIVVLKDATATAIYGASGSNGVILITTKKGKGTPTVKYNFNTGVVDWTSRKFNVLTGEQYRQIIHEMGLDDKIVAYGNVNTDWADVYFRTGIRTNNSLSISGSNDNTNYYISGNIYDEKLPAIQNSLKRYGLRSSINTKITSRLETNFVLGGSFNDNKMFGFSNNFFTNLPIVSPYNPDGSYALYDYAGNRLSSPLAEAYQNDNNQKAIQGFAQGSFTFVVMDGLSFTSRNGIDFTSLNENRYHSMYNLSGRDNNGYAYRNQVQMFNWVSSNMFNYTKNLFNGTLSALIGMEANKSQSTFVGASGYSFPNDYIREINLTPTENRRSSGSRNENSSLSYLGGISYLWKNKYNINANLRRDGDSDFGENVKWGNFYSFGGAWTISNESFWSFAPIHFLKLKTSYGITGNGRFNGNYAKGIYQYSDSYEYGNAVGAVVSRGKNQTIRWETTYKYNAGIDFGMFNRINLGIEYYKNLTHDMIDDALVSMTSGQRNVYQNIGKMQNIGMEFLINADIFKNTEDRFKWNTRINLSLNRNKILEMAEGQDRIYTNAIMRQGYDSRTIYLVRWAGVDPSTGDPMWYDADGNITKVFSTNNRVIIGSPNADFFGGMTNVLSYKGFLLSCQINYMKGGLTFSSLQRAVQHDGLNILSANLPTNALDHWRYPGDLSVNPRLSTISTSSVLNSTRHLYDRSYVQLKNVSLEYRLKEDLIKRVFLKGASIYIQGDNLGLWTPYKSKLIYKEPAFSSSIDLNSSNNSDGAMSTSLSMATYTFGLNLSF